MLRLTAPGPYLAVLPGSRQAEVALLAPVFLQACLRLKARFPTLEFVVPLVNQRRRAQFEAIKAEVAPDLAMTLLDGQARLAMAAADA